MRWSKAFIPTLKENPQEAEAVSHRLMLRAGLIRRLMAGAYIYLPTGYRVLKKAENIIREEMNSSGAMELLMPALQPPELWKKTGRYDVIGDVMIKFKDRHGKEIALGPTHEEIVTDLVSREVRSYKDIPLILYQIQSKFRDEVRPRFGIVRSCEFIMKDAYSFDESVEKLEESYAAMYDAYCRIFSRCGIEYIPVEADPGLMGGNVSHEFMVPSDIGEDRIAVCSECGYAASTEVAEVKDNCDETDVKSDGKDFEEVETPGKSSVEEVSAFLKVKSSTLIKTLIYVTENGPVAVLIRGDHEANEAKIKKQLSTEMLELADEKTVEEVTGGPRGFSGPVGLKLKLIGDFSVRNASGAVVGANIKDKHLLGVSAGRDFEVEDWGDLREITGDDICPKCGKKIIIKTAIEIGHTFKLGVKYSKSLGATFLDASGKEKNLIMGCYGIGVNRILASIIEQKADENGIVWPVTLAPFHVLIIPLNKDDDEIKATAETLYDDLQGEGVEVMIDDREKTAGVKFKDADLVGVPIQVIIGKKGLEKGEFEVKDRQTGEKDMVKTGEIINYLKEQIEAKFKILDPDKKSKG